MAHSHCNTSSSISFCMLLTSLILNLRSSSIIQPGPSPRRSCGTITYNPTPPFPVAYINPSAQTCPCSPRCFTLYRIGTFSCMKQNSFFTLSPGYRVSRFSGISKGKRTLSQPAEVICILVRIIRFGKLSVRFPDPMDILFSFFSRTEQACFPKPCSATAVETEKAETA